MMIDFNPTTESEKAAQDFINEYGQAFYDQALKNGDTKEEATKFAIWALKQIAK